MEGIEDVGPAGESCGACRYFDHVENECRRYAPVLLKLWTGTEAPQFGFPVVSPNHDWCGEYQPGKDAVDDNLRALKIVRRLADCHKGTDDVYEVARLAAEYFGEADE